MDEVYKFDQWMWEIKSKYYFDNEAMNRVYSKIINELKK